MLAGGFSLLPLIAPWILFQFVHWGMHGLHEHPFGWADAFKWCEWVLWTCVSFSVLCIAFAAAAGVTYFAGRCLAVPRARCAGKTSA